MNIYIAKCIESTRHAKNVFLRFSVVILTDMTAQVYYGMTNEECAGMLWTNWQGVCRYVVYWCRKQDEEETRQKFTEVDSNSDGVLTWPEYARKVFGYNEDELLKFAQDTDPEMQTFNRASIVYCHVYYW